MSLRYKYQVLRDVINDCAGYRILEDDDLIRLGDETACGSILLCDRGYEKFVADWTEVDEEEFGADVGKTVEYLNDSASSDMDARERLFRRKL